jgi:hypothetical protein
MSCFDCSSGKTENAGKLALGECHASCRSLDCDGQSPKVCRSNLFPDRDAVDGQSSAPWSVETRFDVAKRKFGISVIQQDMNLFAPIFTF